MSCVDRRNGSADLVFAVHLWPAKDRESWYTGTDPMPGRLRRPRYADGLASRSIQASRQSYGRFLAVLEMNCQLDPEIGPAERVTPDKVALYFDELRAAGNLDNTIKGRMMHLRTAQHIMAPGRDFDWITRPDGVSLDALLKQLPREDMVLPSALELFEWGLSLMVDEKLPTEAFARIEYCRRYRNGLIIALLACRAPRLESLSRMRLGKNLERVNGEYWVRLESLIVKNRRTLEYSLPANLTSYLDRYLTEIRPQVLDPASTDAAWGNGDGGGYSYRSIGTMIFRQSEVRFGESFGAHRFRHALASTLAAADPSNPGLAAAVLGITEAVVNEHYRKARQKDAGRKFQEDLKGERVRAASSTGFINSQVTEQF
jgi:integrase